MQRHPFFCAKIYLCHCISAFHDWRNILHWWEIRSIFFKHRHRRPLPFLLRALHRSSPVRHLCISFFFDVTVWLTANKSSGWPLFDDWIANTTFLTTTCLKSRLLRSTGHDSPVSRTKTSCRLEWFLWYSLRGLALQQLPCQQRLGQGTPLIRWMKVNKIQQYVQQVFLTWPSSSSTTALRSASKSGDSEPAFQFYYDVCETAGQWLEQLSLWPRSRSTEPDEPC